MTRYMIRFLLMIVLTGSLQCRVAPVLTAYGDSADQAEPETVASQPIAQSYQPYFRYPVVPGGTISGYFDHNPANDIVTHYNGLQNNSPSYGFFFSCPSVGMYDFVGCADNVSGEGACSNNRELWYDGHRGIDYEFSPNWHTGAVCDPGRFSGLTMPIYAPARGKVLFAGYDPHRPGNGWHIRLKHDLNNNGNFDDDNFRSVYLHFTANSLAVYAGQIVPEGAYLGLGGTTGYSSSPHLHFEVQRSADYFQSTYWSVDPFGWSGIGNDPWPYRNDILFRYDLSNKLLLPMLVKQDPDLSCDNCGDWVQNGGFESGRQVWVEQGVEIITSTARQGLPAAPFRGNWLAWLGGRNYASDVLYQNITVPNGAVGMNLSYALRVDTTETGGSADLFRVRLRDSNGNLLRELDGVDNTFSQRGQWVARSVSVDDIGGWAGQTLRLSFEAVTDYNAITSFYLDEVVLTGR